ncbi:Rab GTPase [Pelomyxa schiedti]|nr:Rab GTPase [Pelomyxa schiedti]
MEREFLRSHSCEAFFFKVLLEGDTGKRCILERFAPSWPGAHVSAIGIDFRLKLIECDGKLIRLQIWNRTGNWTTSVRTAPYYRGAQGVAIVFDCTNMQSYINVKQRFVEIEQYASENIIKILVASKTDLASQRVIPTSMAKEFADSMDIPFIETSAKYDINVDEMFMQLARPIKDRLLELIVQLKLSLLFGIGTRTGAR